MDKNKLIEAKKILQRKLRLVENALDNMQKNRMGKIAGISEDDGYYSPTAQDEKDFDEVIDRVGDVFEEYGEVMSPEQREMAINMLAGDSNLQYDDDKSMTRVANIIADKLMNSAITESEEESGTKKSAQALPRQQARSGAEQNIDKFKLTSGNYKEKMKNLPLNAGQKEKIEQHFKNKRKPIKK